MTEDTARPQHRFTPRGFIVGFKFVFSNGYEPHMTGDFHLNHGNGGGLRRVGSISGDDGTQGENMQAHTRWRAPAFRGPGCNIQYSLSMERR